LDKPNFVFEYILLYPFEDEMINVKTFQEYNKLLLEYIDRIIRYRHHIAFISTYVKYKKIPKGFMLNFHSNIPELTVDGILKKSSTKVMEKTLR